MLSVFLERRLLLPDLSSDEFQARRRAFEDVRRFAVSRNPDSRYGDMVSQFAREMNDLGK